MKNEEDNARLEALMTPEERRLYEGYKRRLGKEFTPHHTHGMFVPLFEGEPVTKSRIATWAAVTGDDNPLWSDDIYAARSRWGGIIAPPLFLLTVNDGATPGAQLVGELYEPAPNPVLNLKAYPTYRGAMQAEADWQFFEPVRPGDRIAAVARCTDVFWKQGSRFRLMFCMGETVYTNQHGRRVALCRNGAVYMFKRMP